MSDKRSGIFSSYPPSSCFTLLMFTVTPIIAILVAIAIPNMLHSIQRSRAKSTLKTIQQIARSIEALKTKEGYPILRSANEISRRDNDIQILDGWGNEIRIFSQADGYYIIGLGKDGQAEFSNPSNYPAGQTMNLNKDIAYHTGRFVQYPEGLDTSERDP